MPALTETHRSFVNTWECDENEHMNVQFYMKRFDEAARFHHLISGGLGEMRQPSARHIRYHAELRAGDLNAVRSGRVTVGPHAGRVIHLLENIGTGRLAATAVDITPSETREPIDDLEMPGEACARSLSDGSEPCLGKAELLAAGGLVTHRRIVQPAECDFNATLLVQNVIGMASDAAPHVWHAAGYGSAWLVENGFGRVAVEMKVSVAGLPVAGDLVELASAPAALGNRTMQLHHELVRLSDGKALARVDVVALVIDLATRRAVGADKFAELRALAAS